MPAASGRARGRLGRQLTPVPKQLPSAEQTVIGARCLLLPFCRPFLSSVPTAPDFHPSPPHRRRLLNSSPKLRPRHFFFPASATATVCAAAPAVSAQPPLLPYRRCRRTSGASRPPGSSSASSSISTPLSSPVDSLLSPSLPPSLPSFPSTYHSSSRSAVPSVRPSNRPQISFLFLLQSSPSLSSVVAVAATVATATAAAQSQLTNKSDDVVVVDVPKNIPLKRNPHPARLRGPNAANGGAGAAQEGT